MVSDEIDTCTYIMFLAITMKTHGYYGVLFQLRDFQFVLLQNKII